MYQIIQYFLNSYNYNILLIIIICVSNSIPALTYFTWETTVMAITAKILAFSIVSLNVIVLINIICLNKQRMEGILSTNTIRMRRKLLSALYARVRNYKRAWLPFIFSCSAMYCGYSMPFILLTQLNVPVRYLLWLVFIIANILLNYFRDIQLHRWFHHMWIYLQYSVACLRLLENNILWGNLLSCLHQPIENNNKN